MTTADRLRAAVEAALPEGFYVIDPMHGKIADIDCSLRALVLAAVQPIVEELERDAARYRHLRRNCQYGFDDHDYPQLIHRNGETGAHQNPRGRDDLDAAIDAAMKGERDGE
mgnify:FL=1